MDVAILGVGFCGSFPKSDGLSYRELIRRAATQAYADAGIEASELEGAISCEEDFVSGYSIADEYVPDQLGVQMKSVYTICGDFLHGFSSATMQLKTGRFKLLAVESYCKASNMINKDEVLNFAYDPVWNRFDVTPNYLAGIEMQQFLERSDYSTDDVANVVTDAKAKGLANSLAPYGSHLPKNEILGGRSVASPVTESMIAKPADAAVVFVLGTQEANIKKARKPVFISGTGWSSGNSVLERRDHAASPGTKEATKMAFTEAKVSDPNKDLDAIYISDLYAHRALMHLDAMGIKGGLNEKINPDGGSISMGDLIEANGGARIYDAVLQLRGEAGSHQLPNVKRAVAQGWRGLPTDSCAVVVLDQERTG